MEKDWRLPQTMWKSILMDSRIALGFLRCDFHTNAEYDHAFAIRDEMYGQMEEILRASGAEIFPYQKVAPVSAGQRHARSRRLPDGRRSQDFSAGLMESLP